MSGVGQRRNACRILWAKSVRKHAYERPRRRWEKNKTVRIYLYHVKMCPVAFFIVRYVGPCGSATTLLVGMAFVFGR
jgi:hypothetical protein